MAAALSVRELESRIGQEVGVSPWVEVTQERIDLFAKAIDDPQWIHVDPERAKQSPFGTTIAHGFLTLSLLTKFIESRQFERLPFDQQRQFYKVLDDRDSELDQAFSASKINESEYRAGLEAAWLGKHINRVEKYFALPPGQSRTTYLTKLVDKKERKKTKNKTPGGKPGDIDADEAAAELKVEKWPPAVRTQWNQFHEAYRSQKKAIEKAAKPPTTKPVA